MKLKLGADFSTSFVLIHYHALIFWKVILNFHGIGFNRGVRLPKSAYVSGKFSKYFFTGETSRCFMLKDLDSWSQHLIMC